MLSRNFCKIRNKEACKGIDNELTIFKVLKRRKAFTKISNWFHEKSEFSYHLRISTTLWNTKTCHLLFGSNN